MGNSLICIASPNTSEECGEVVVVANNPSSQNYTKNYYNNTYNFSNPHNNNNNNNNKCISVVDCVQGRVTHMPPPVQVAELMLEFTGCFVVHMDTDATGQDHESSASLSRLRPMAACEEARPGHVYMAVPMHRLNQRLGPQDWSAIRHIIGLVRAGRHIDPVPAPVSIGSGTCGFAHHHRGGAKVAPLVTIDNNAFQDSLLPSNDTNNEDAIREIIGAIFNKAGAGAAAAGTTREKDVERCNSTLRTKPWAPKLDTISE